jgi:hypothetical protein
MGKLSYSQTVSSIWPAFAQAGKANITVQTVLSHRAGLHTLPPVWKLVLAFLRQGWVGVWSTGKCFVEQSKPSWIPGSEARYHPVSWSWLVGGVAEHAGKEHITQLLHRLVAAPLDCEGDMHMGCLPVTETCRVVLNEPPSWNAVKRFREVSLSQSQDPEHSLEPATCWSRLKTSMVEFVVAACGYGAFINYASVGSREHDSD